jgi:hypothetical protein
VADAPLVNAPVADAPPIEAPATPVLPARPAPAARVPVAAGLPARSAAAGEPVAPTTPQTPTTPPTEASALLAQSDLASSALSELRGLYEPTFAPLTSAPVVEATAPLAGGLVRRTPKSAEPATPTAAAPPRSRQRSAAEVRGMLSGFRAGVERGRTSDPADGQHDTENAETKDAT